MNKIVIITPYVRLDTAVTLERILEEVDSNNIVEQVIINEYMTFKTGVIYASKVVSCNKLIVIRELDGNISDNTEILVDMASELGTSICYYD